MAAKLPPDRFDEMRRDWIAHHQRWSTIQRRRAERLGRIVRRRQRVQTAAVPDPHDDTVLDPLWLRTGRSPASQVELVGVMTAAVLAPLGWPIGRWLAAAITALIPGTLAGFPIAALLWSGVGLAGLTVLADLLSYDPAGSFGQVVVLPWLALQAAAVPLTAGLYGVADGWLAVEASRRWWPMTPPRPALTAADAAAILGGNDLTGPGVIDARPLPDPGQRTRP